MATRVIPESAVSCAVGLEATDTTLMIPYIIQTPAHGDACAGNAGLSQQRYKAGIYSRVTGDG